MKKIITLVIMLLFIGMTVSSLAEETTLNDDDLDVNISAGLFGLDIGRSIYSDIINNRNESVTAYRNLTVDDAFFDSRDFNRSSKHNIRGNSHSVTVSSFISSVAHFSITVEGGNTKVTREGIVIFSMFFFFK